MKRPYSIIAGLLLSIPALAQSNFNPTIVVTNAYEGSAADIHKPVQKMQVPDSVMKFNLDFDYSVFSNPYRGAYEFRPYLVSMKPRAEVRDESTLYVRAGAGYALRPEAEVVWTPSIGHGFTLGVHGNLDGFIGRYRLISSRLDEQVRRYEPSGEKAPGLDLRGGVGADLTYAAGWGQAGVGLSCLNQSNRDPLLGADVRASIFNQFGINAFARSYNLLEPGWTWQGTLDYRFGGDRLDAYHPHEHLVSLDGTFGRILADNQRVSLDAGFHLARSGDATWSTGGLVSVKPRYVLRTGRFLLDLGLLFTAHLRDNAGVTDRPACYGTGTQVIYPAIHVRYGILEDQLTAYADMTGGSHLNTYSSLLEGHHFLRWNYLMLGGTPLDFSVERVRVALGLRGQVAERLQLDLSGGYTVWGHALLEAAPYNDDELPRMGYGDYEAAFVAFTYGWKSRSILVDGSLSYRHFMMKTDRVFTPAPFSGDIRALYDWNGRIRGGIYAEFASAREAVYDSYANLRIPGYVDLGLGGDFRLTSRFGLWLRVGNLLNQPIQRHVLYAEDGVSVTGGITFNLR